MFLEDLFETLKELMEQGHGDYLVCVAEEGDFEHTTKSYGVDIDYEHEEIVIKGI